MNMGGRPIGIIYAAFGERSAAAVLNSYHSIKASIPAIVVGTHPVPGLAFSEWQEETPWTGAQKGRKFLAGKVKPILYDYSPFEYTLYLDADTEICGDIIPGFNFLEEYDFCIAEDGRYIENTYKYTKLEPAWDWARKERDFTTGFLGKSQNREINSGVFFFRKGLRAKELFEEWYAEWLRYQQWDEQFAFLRAAHSCPGTKIKYLPRIWNEHNPTKPKIIWHKWGTARDRGK